MERYLAAMPQFMGKSGRITDRSSPWIRKTHLFKGIAYYSSSSHTETANTSKKRACRHRQALFYAVFVCRFFMA